MELSVNSITFGKYKGSTLEEVLKDRDYCHWLVKQDWFQSNYEYLYNKVLNYDPLEYICFDLTIDEYPQFVDEYKFFRLKPVEEIKLSFSDTDIVCYKHYYNLVLGLRDKIKERLTHEYTNPYDVKTPPKWLQKFETDTGLSRSVLKDFLSSYGLPNITSIIENIKKEGGIEYKGAKSFTIAKKNSQEQEKYWEVILKDLFGENICSQFKYEDCIFDFLDIPNGIIYECKLGLKDFNEDQYRKYLLALSKYKIIYLIGKDCIIDTKSRVIYTTNYVSYIFYQCNIPLLSKPSQFDNLILDYEVEEVSSLVDILTKNLTLPDK